MTTEAYKKDKSSGILRIRCLGNVIIEKGGKIDVSELGWKGGKNNGLSADGIDVSGMSLGGKLGTCDKKPNHGGGGGGESSSKYGSSAGAGAGYDEGVGAVGAVGGWLIGAAADSVLNRDDDAATADASWSFC